MDYISGLTDKSLRGVPSGIWKIGFCNDVILVRAATACIACALEISKFFSTYEKFDMFCALNGETV